MQKLYTLKQLAEYTGAEFIGNPTYETSGVDELSTATPSDVSFLANDKYKSLMQTTKAGVICVNKEETLCDGVNYLICDDPSETFQKIIHLVFGPPPSSGFTGIHPTAVIHHSAKLGHNVEIGPHVVIDKDCSIGDNTKIMSGVVIYPGASIGSHSIIHSNASIRENCVIGNRVILQSGVVIGGCGYGFITNKFGKHEKIIHFGNVILKDDVEIGSNTTIDRARFKSTIISKGSKIDNLVMIGHNVKVGEDNLIVAQTGISGSSKTGRNVVLGGQVGVVGHVELGDGVIIMARGVISKSVMKRGIYGGTPAQPRKEYHKHLIHLKKIIDYANKLKNIEQKLEELEAGM